MESLLEHVGLDLLFGVVNYIEPPFWLTIAARSAVFYLTITIS